jgi:hypothetical protein
MFDSSLIFLFFVFVYDKSTEIIDKIDSTEIMFWIIDVFFFVIDDFSKFVSIFLIFDVSNVFIFNWIDDSTFFSFRFFYLTYFSFRKYMMKSIFQIFFAKKRILEISLFSMFSFRFFLDQFRIEIYLFYFSFWFWCLIYWIFFRFSFCSTKLLMCIVFFLSYVLRKITYLDNLLLFVNVSMILAHSLAWFLTVFDTRAVANWFSEWRN